MAIRNTHHVGCVVSSIEEGYAFWRDAVGLPVTKEVELSREGLRVAFLSMGNAFIELLQPTRSGTEVAAFLERTGIGGLHHVCLETENAVSELAALKERGAELLDGGLRQTAAGVGFFAAPRATQAVLVEVVQPEQPTKIDGVQDGALFDQLTMFVTQTANCLRAASQWELNFGLQAESYLVHPEADNRHVVLPTSAKGPVYIEVITPLTEAGKNAAYLRKAGDGLFQLAVRTQDVRETARRLRDAGFRIQQEEGMSLTDEPASFVHPKSSGGVFITFGSPRPAPSGPIPKEAWELRLKDEYRT